jgi:RNA polymerase sigma-70 factor (ECF subfamily)
VTHDEVVIGRVFRLESGRAVAAVISMFGDIDLAEDAVQEAFTIALQKWPVTGVPPNPGAWVTATARNRAIDRLRRDARGANLLRDVAAQARTSRSSDELSEEEVVPDDRLRLIFTCCHPALAPQGQIELTLRLVCGLSTAEVARAFLASEPTMAKRLVRAKHKIKVARIPYRVPEQSELPDRLPRVLTAIYLTYTTGQAKQATEPDLCAEAVRLGRILRLLMADEAEVAGLLALMLLTESRRATRTDSQGELVLLRDQDRTGWDPSLIEEGQALIHWCLRRNRPGPYQLQAAIAAVHAEAVTFQDTDWHRILALYDRLIRMAPTPVVALNRAVALGEVHGAEAALREIDDLALVHYYPYHAARAEFLQRQGRTDEAARAYLAAASLAPGGPDKHHLRRRAERLSY